MDVFIEERSLPFVILSGVGANATAQSKDLCIFPVATKTAITRHPDVR